MAGINGFGNTQNNFKLTTVGQASNLKNVELKNNSKDQPSITPTAVWIGKALDDGSIMVNDPDFQPGDVVILPDGTAHRYCINEEGDHYLAEITKIKADDYESDRGDIRRT